MVRWLMWLCACVRACVVLATLLSYAKDRIEAVVVVVRIQGTRVRRSTTHVSSLGWKASSRKAAAEKSLSYNTTACRVVGEMSMFFTIFYAATLILTVYVVHTIYDKCTSLIISTSQLYHYKELESHVCTVDTNNIGHSYF